MSVGPLVHRVGTTRILDLCETFPVKELWLDQCYSSCRAQRPRELFGWSALPEGHPGTSLNLSRFKLQLRLPSIILFGLIELCGVLALRRGICAA